MSLTLLKEAVSRDFLAFFFSLIQPIWVPDKQSKMVSLKNSFSRRYLQKTWLCAVWYCAELDSGLVWSIWWYFENVSKNISKIKKWLTLRRVRLHTVSHWAESNSAQYHTARSQTPCSITLRGVRLCAVWDYFGFSDISISRLCTVWYCAESNNFIWFSKTSISRTFRVYMMIFRKCFENISKIENWLTLRRVFACLSLPWLRILIFFKYMCTIAT